MLEVDTLMGAVEVASIHVLLGSEILFAVTVMKDAIELDSAVLTFRL